MLTRHRIVRLALLTAMSTLVITVYMVFFKHPPPEELLLMNRKAALEGGYRGFGADSFGGDQGEEMRMKEQRLSDEEELEKENDGLDDDILLENRDREKDSHLAEEEDSKLEEEAKQLEDLAREKVAEEKRKNNENEDNESGKENLEDKRKKERKNGRRVQQTEEETSRDHKEKNSKGKQPNSEVTGTEFWTKFLKKNQFVPIGVVYSKCEGHREQLGTVAMLADKENGGVKSRTFMNITIEKEITGGQFYIEVIYNGQPLYDNYWELCELEEDLPVVNKTFTCPIHTGKWILDKQKHVPNYLPKGRFQTKAWAVDENKDMIACGYSDFTL